MSKAKVVQTDIIIAGGGLAGLTLAHQLCSLDQNLSIAIVEKNTFPVPEAVAKVGESTVEIGSHYLKETIGLAEHFKEHQLKKFGLRCFFGGNSAGFSKLDELGVSESFGIPTYQLDRGRIENYLASTLPKDTVTIYDGYTTQELALDGSPKRLVAKNQDETLELQGKWLLDAAGRQSLVKSQLGLSQQCGHKGNAIWFRLDREIRIDDWVDDEEWQRRCTPKSQRWLSTNHLMGPGYWVWIIPLAFGITSIGIVCDDLALKDSGITQQGDVLPWLQKQHPCLADAITGAQFLDFHLIRDYAYDCKKVFSSDGWALTGEAGVFSDPFYSPGSDFIAISNTLITEMIRSQTHSKQHGFQAAAYQGIYQSIFQNTLSLYQANYGGFGDRRMMGLKLLWDYSYYWGILTLLFYRQALPDTGLMQKLTPSLKQCGALHQQVQALFRSRAKQRQVLSPQGLFLDQYNIPCLHHFNNVLKQPDGNNLEAEIKHHSQMLTQIAGFVENMLSASPDRSIGQMEKTLLGSYRELILA